MSGYLTDAENHHLWDKTHKCKATTSNVTVSKDALLHILMDHQKLTAKAEQLQRAVYSGRKLSELPALLETS